MKEKKNEKTFFELNNRYKQLIIDKQTSMCSRAMINHDDAIRFKSENLSAYSLTDGPNISRKLDLMNPTCKILLL